MQKPAQCTIKYKCKK